MLLQPHDKKVGAHCLYTLLTFRGNTMKLYSSEAVENLAQKYIARGGIITVLEESVLLEYGLAIFQADGAKSTVVRDKFLNEWSSAYIVRMYNKLPKKYEQMLLKKMQECDGVHDTVEEICKCKSCELVLVNH